MAERSPSGWRISALIDFEDVVAADPLLDLAKTYYYSLRRTNATLDALAAGYGSLREDWRDGVLLYALVQAVELWAWLLEIGETERIPAIAADVRALVAGEPLPVSAFP
jgi:hygromycin-B 7''-O-kinase